MDEAVRIRLEALSEEKFRDFSSSLVPGCGDMMGVRVPALRAIAREAVRSGGWRAMLASDDDRWFEERVLRGMLIGLAPASPEQRLAWVRDFVPRIDNWAVCDIFCAGLKFAAANRQTVWPLLEECLASPQTYALRFAVVMLLDHYLCDEYIGAVLDRLAAVRSEFPRMQVCVLTAFRDFDYAQRAMHLGACRYLLKPSRMDELNEAVREMIRRLDALPRANEQEAETPDGETGSTEASSFVVRAALSYMQAHCTQKLSLGDVADNVYVSQWHLSKLINKHTGQSFFDLLGSMRIERAKKLLADPSMRVHTVAEQTGFADVAHFSKSFKKITGQTPGEYRAGLK